MSPQAIPTKLLLRALHGETLVPPPLWLMRQAGRYLPEYRAIRKRAGSFLDLCYSPDLATEVTLQPVERFATDAAILFSDILVVPHALGVELSFEEGSGPRLSPIGMDDSLPELALERFHEHLAPVYRTVRQVAASLSPEVALIGFAGAPWTIATYMIEGGSSRDFARAKRWVVSDSDGFGRLMDLIVDATVAYLVEQARHGAEAVQLFDSWAGALPANLFWRWCIAPTRAIVDRVHAACPGLPVIGFARGAGLMLSEYAAGSGVDAVGIDSGVPVAWAAQELQPRGAVQGNLDPLYLAAGGENMRREARSVLAALAGGPFVFNLGHGVIPQTPPENVADLVDTVRAWRP